MDLEARILQCITFRAAMWRHFSKALFLRGDFGTEMEALVTWLAAESEGVTIGPEQSHAMSGRCMRRARSCHCAGPHDFSCATRYEQSDMDPIAGLPDLTSHEGAAEACMARRSYFPASSERWGGAARLLPSATVA